MKSSLLSTSSQKMEITSKNTYVNTFKIHAIMQTYKKGIATLYEEEIPYNEKNNQNFSFKIFGLTITIIIMKPRNSLMTIKELFLFLFFLY